ncbi:MAG: LPS export ABC transporter permease LptG [Gammaproteobacteria bacterium]
MKILDRYLGMAVATSTLIVMLVLIALFFFIDLVDQLGDVGKGNYGLAEAIQYLLLVQPRNIYTLFPLAALLGSLLGLGWLASNSELLVLRAAGISLGQISLSVMKVGLLMIMAVTFIGEVVAPASEQYAQSLRSVALSNRITLKTDYGFWTRDGTSFINIRTVLPGQRLGDINIYEFDDTHQLRVATYAKNAHFKKGRWMLEGIIQSRVSEAGVDTRQVARATWESLLSPDLVNVLSITPERLSTLELYKYIDYLHNNGQDAKPYELAFWTRLSWPLTTAIMTFMAIPFVFGSLRSTSMGQRMLTGSLVGIGFYLFNQTFSQIGLVYNFNPIFSALLPISLFFMLSLILVRKIR